MGHQPSILSLRDLFIFFIFPVTSGNSVSQPFATVYQASLQLPKSFPFPHLPLFFTSSFLEEGNDTPLQYSRLENPMDGGAWWAAVHGVANSRTRLSDFTFTFHFHALEKEMAPTPVFLPGEFQGRGAWWAAVYGGRTESDTTEVT